MARQCSCPVYPYFAQCICRACHSLHAHVVPPTPPERGSTWVVTPADNVFVIIVVVLQFPAPGRVASAATFRQFPTSAASRGITATGVREQHHLSTLIVMLSLYIANRLPHTLRHVRRHLAVPLFFRNRDPYKRQDQAAIMPTPPFCQSRRDILTEISGLFAKKSKTKDTARTPKSIGTLPKGCESATTISTCNSSHDGASAKDQAMGVRPGRLG